MLLCLPHQVWTLTQSPEPFWETLGMGRIPPNSQKFTDFPNQKNSLLINLHSLLSKLLFLPHQIATFMYVITLHKLHMQLQSLLLYHFFLPSAFMFTHVSLPWQKHWMVKIPPSKICTPPTFQCYLENPASLNDCFNLFPTPFFISSFIKFHMTLLQLWFRQTTFYSKNIFRLLTKRVKSTCNHKCS